MVQQGGRVTLPQWQAMHGVLGGAMPTWVDSHGRPNEDRKQAKTVSVLVRAMQGVLEERLKEHRRKAAPAAAWITEREERRGLIRHVFAAWAGTRGSHNVPDVHYSRDAWQEWRRRENPQQRKARRICEAVRRVASFAQCCFNKFWANRERNRRMLRLKLAVLRKRPARVTTGRAPVTSFRALFGARVLPWTRRVGPSAFRHLWLMWSSACGRNAGRMRRASSVSNGGNHFRRDVCGST